MLPEHRLELGYWRKHPNLHGFIIQEFANGEDQCQEIELDSEAIYTIINAITNNQLPYTIGFFFGESTNSRKEKSHTIQIFKNALSWLDTPEKGIWRSVIYQASW